MNTPQLQSSTNLLPRDGRAYLIKQFLPPHAADPSFGSLLDEVDFEQRIGAYNRPQPRLTAWEGPVGYKYSRTEHEPTPFSPTTLRLLRRVRGITRGFNCVLFNLYRSGSDYVAFHSDDEELFGNDPTIASLSLGATRTLVFSHTETKERLKVDLPHGSLLVMEGPTQRLWKHSILKTTRDVGLRVNATFRTALDSGGFPCEVDAARGSHNTWAIPHHLRVLAR
jgi:alkylated DNA repair dioxygenase AlkB